MNEFREFKVKALIQAILEAQRELESLFRKRVKNDTEEAEAIPNLHGNIKASNIFIENAG